MAWEILPFEGLAPFRFGMSPEVISTFDPIFGAPQRRVSELDAAQPIIDVMEQYVDQSPEIVEAIERMKLEKQDEFTEYRQLSSPIVRYRKNLLFEIVLVEGCELANLKRIYPFNDDREVVVAAFTKLNGQRRKRDGVYLFDRIGIMLHGYADGGNRVVNIIDQPAVDRESERFPLDV